MHKPCSSAAVMHSRWFALAAALRRRIVCEWLSAEGEARGAAAAAGSGAAAARDSAAASDAIEVLWPLSGSCAMIGHPWQHCQAWQPLSKSLCRCCPCTCTSAPCQHAAAPAPLHPDLATACSSGRSKDPGCITDTPSLTANGRLWRRRCPRRWVTSWPRRPHTQRPAQAIRSRLGSCCALRRAARCACSRGFAAPTVVLLVIGRPAALGCVVRKLPAVALRNLAAGAGWSKICARA